MTAGFSLRGLLIVLGIVALGLIAAFAGLFGVISQIDRLNAGVAIVREAQLGAADVLRLQIEEETGLRGFAATHSPAFRETYHDATLEFPIRAAFLAERLVLSPEDARAAGALVDARAINSRWISDVARPVFSDGSRRLDDLRAKRDIDRFRSDLEIVNAVLIDDYHRLIRQRKEAVRLAAVIGYSAIGVVALQIVVYAILAERLRGELARERRVVTVLQRAFTSEIVSDRQLDVGAAYVSATLGAKVGGDVYDIFPLDEDRTLVAIADASGKGVEAAVDSTFVKYSLRAFASEGADIAAIVTKFNTLFARAQKSPETFVVLFAGILDRRAGTLSYVNAGHEAAFIRRAASLELLEPTGPIIGLAGNTSFAAATTQVTADDLLFLATDGLTEARDPSGAFLGGNGVASWLRDTRNESPERVVDEVTRRLRQYTRSRSNDDLAILAVRPKQNAERTSDLTSPSV